MLIAFIILSVIVIALFNKKERLINYGKFAGSKHTIINKHKYYIEEVKFSNSHESLHSYYKVIADISNYGKALEVKYDLYDWTFNIFRFEDTTIAVYNMRSLSKIKLVKSNEPITIYDYEIDKPAFK